MKIAAGVLGIIAGIFGIMGGFATVFVGAIGEAVEVADASTVMNLGAAAFWVSFIIVVLGIVAFFKPKGSGIGLVVCGVITFIASNYFSGPLAILGGVFGILDARYKKSNQIATPDINLQNAQTNLLKQQTEIKGSQDINPAPQ